MFNNPFLKKDPLLEAVKTAQADGETRRAAVAMVNEEFGVYSRNAVIRENLAAYDAAIESAYTDLKEGLSPKQEKMASLAGDKKKIDAPDLAALRSGKKLDEEPVDYSGKSTVTQDRDPKATSYDKTLPQTYPGGATSDAAGQRVSNAKAPVTPVKEDRQSTLRSYIDKAHERMSAAKEGGFKKGGFDEKKGPKAAKARAEFSKRGKGLGLAGKRLAEEEAMNEEKKKWIEQNGNYKNSSYWPHFSFRPSLLKTDVFKELGDFDERKSHFEMDYASRFTNAGFKTAFLDGIYRLHIGKLIGEEGKKNAYELNELVQFAQGS